MTCRLTLTLPPAFGNKIVQVDIKRFSIGRTPENDLSIEDTSLSRRHALIEDVEGRYNLYDCGSSNGTFVNGHQITSPTELSDWDVLTFGGVSDVLVRIEQDQSVPDYATANSLVEDRGTPETAVAQALEPKVASDNHSFFSTPVVAVAAAFLIMLASGVVLLFINASNETTPPPIKKQQQTSNVNDDLTPSPDESPTISDSNNSSSNTSSVESTELRTIEAYASRVLSGISRDPHPVLTEKSLAEINGEVQRYQGGSSLEEELQAMRRALPQVSAFAKTNGLRTPMAVYATLATIDKNGGRGDPTQIAASLCPALAKLRGVFGDELANDSLLTVAALEEGPSLQARITRLAGRVNDSPTTIRSIWYLHDHQVISDQTYRFVLRFITIGVIAQDPRKFGIAADPIVF